MRKMEGMDALEGASDWNLIGRATMSHPLILRREN